MTATWRRGPGGIWLVYGRVRDFSDALAGDRQVQARRKDGTTSSVTIERCTTPNFEGYGYAWPTGTTKHETTTTRLEPGPVDRPPHYLSTKSYRRAIRRKARQRGQARAP